MAVRKPINKIKRNNFFIRGKDNKIYNWREKHPLQNSEEFYSETEIGNQKLNMVIG